MDKVMTDDITSIRVLSIIVPVLNELNEIPEFFKDLARQEDITFELLICDGGSMDGTLEWLADHQVHYPHLRIISGPSGRARQLNQGIAQADKDWLLLLHVDSRFEDTLALRRALDRMIALPSHNVAGHFSLCFRRDQDDPSLPYYFYEWKARTGFDETIHGDQGFLIHRSLAEIIGPFDERLMVMEDTDFSDRLRQVGQWQLLSEEISTSSRRFEIEGLWQRQLLGALIMCFRKIDWNDFFEASPSVYRQQAKSDKLRVLPFFELVRQLMRERTFSERWHLWYASGSYVRRHCWQLFFSIDARLAFRSGKRVGMGKARFLDFLQPLYTFLTDNIVGRICATLLLRSWFEITRTWLKQKEKG
jgi:rSAM/selenodomain-associated transferase 2